MSTGSRTLARAAARLLLLLAVTAPSSVAEVTVQEALAHVREAFGWPALAAGSAGWEIRGRCEEQGLPGTFVNLMDPDGRFRADHRTRLPTTVAHDGEVVWALDHTGMPRTLALLSRDTALGGGWTELGLWLDPEHPRVEVSVDEERSDDERLALHLAYGTWTGTLLVARETWLPTELESDEAGGVVRLEFDDYRAPHGFQVPHATRVHGVGGDVSTYTVEEVRKAPAFLRDPYAPIDARPQDVTFSTEIPPELAETKAAVTGHLLVHPRVDGKDVGWFLLDSGAGMNCIDPAVADELGLDRFGEVSVVGVGGATLASFRAGTELELGPATFKGLPWVEYDLAPLEPHLGVELGGVLGYDVFARSVVVIAPADHRVWIHDPERWSSPPEASPLALDHATPCVECSFAGDRRGWFRLDTGSDDTVSFHGPAVVELGLTEGRDDLETVSMIGVGGMRSVERGPIDYFQLGPRRFEDVTVTFFPPGLGALNTRGSLGNVGGGLLRHFRVAFDMPHLEVSFLPLE